MSLTIKSSIIFEPNSKTKYESGLKEDNGLKRFLDSLFLSVKSNML